jgi:isopropylmalate/homocitrate/citramalate synthase
MTRYVHFASRLTGWNAIKSRAAQLNIEMTDEQYKECTAKIKALAGQPILLSLTTATRLKPSFPEH